MAEVLPDGGAQYLERRGFERLYGKNPIAQVRGIKFLLGLQVHIEGGATGDHLEQDLLAVTQLLRRFTNDFNEWSKEEYQLDADTGGGVYRCDPELQAAVQSALRNTSETL